MVLIDLEPHKLGIRVNEYKEQWGYKGSLAGFEIRNANFAIR